MAGTEGTNGRLLGTPGRQNPGSRVDLCELSGENHLPKVGPPFGDLWIILDLSYFDFQDGQAFVGRHVVSPSAWQIRQVTAEICSELC